MSTWLARLLAALFERDCSNVPSDREAQTEWVKEEIFYEPTRLEREAQTEWVKEEIFYEPTRLEREAQTEWVKEEIFYEPTSLEREAPD